MEFHDYHLIVSNFNTNGLILISNFHISLNAEQNILKNNQ